MPILSICPILVQNNFQVVNNQINFITPNYIDINFSLNMILVISFAF